MDIETLYAYLGNICSYVHNACSPIITQTIGYAKQKSMSNANFHSYIRTKSTTDVLSLQSMTLSCGVHLPGVQMMIAKPTL